MLGLKLSFLFLKLLNNNIYQANNDFNKSLEKARKQHTRINRIKPFFYNVIIDDMGYHWISYHPNYAIDNKNERNRLIMRVLNSEGEYLGDTRWPEEKGRINKGHLLSLHEDITTGTISLIVYEIRSAIQGYHYP